MSPCDTAAGALRGLCVLLEEVRDRLAPRARTTHHAGSPFLQRWRINAGAAVVILPARARRVRSTPFAMVAFVSLLLTPDRTARPQLKLLSHCTCSRHVPHYSLCACVVSQMDAQGCR